MSTDRELLELAAKAAGYAVEIAEMGGDTVGRWLPGPDKKPGFLFWQPLREDGDALRLAVKLGFSIITEPFFVRIHGINDALLVREEVVLNGYDATRRAIVRAAAELAKD